MLGVYPQGMRHRFSGQVAIQWIGLFGIVRHCHYGWNRAAFNFDPHGVPDELAGATERKIANVFCLVNPGLFVLGFGFFLLCSFFLGNNNHRFSSGFGFFKTLLLFGSQYVFGVLQRTCSRNDVVRRNGDGYRVVAKRQRELPLTQELLVLPAIVVVINGQTREPLGDGVQVVTIFGEELVTTTRIGSQSRVLTVVDVVVPADLQLDFTRFSDQRSRQINPHHRFDDGEFQGFARRVFYVLNLVTTVKRIVQHAVQLTSTDAPAQIIGGCFVGIRFRMNHILIQL